MILDLKKEKSPSHYQRVGRSGEPGIKIGTSNYKTIAKFCDPCGDVYTHFMDDTKAMICSRCGTISYPVRGKTKTLKEVIKVKPKIIKLSIESLIFGF